jgi:hypothetical protein
MRVFMARFNIKQESLKDLQSARDRILDGLFVGSYSSAN